MLFSLLPCGQGYGEGSALGEADVGFSESPVTPGQLVVGRILRERLSAGHSGRPKDDLNSKRAHLPHFLRRGPEPFRNQKRHKSDHPRIVVFC